MCSPQQNQIYSIELHINHSVFRENKMIQGKKDFMGVTLAHSWRAKLDKAEDKLEKLLIRFMGKKNNCKSLIYKKKSL